MKRSLIVLMLIVSMLAGNTVLAAVSFKDVSQSHWAYSYIDKMQSSSIINGYPDNTFKPDEYVKTSELIKMTSLITWKNFEYKAPEEGVHWAMPYVKSLEWISYKPGAYDSETILQSNITRGDAVKIISKAFLQKRSFDGKTKAYDNDEKYIKDLVDVMYSDDEELKKAVIICTQFGIINGFGDGSFRPEATLTRAQVAKIMCIITNS